MNDKLLNDGEEKGSKNSSFSKAKIGLKYIDDDGLVIKVTSCSSIFVHYEGYAEGCVTNNEFDNRFRILEKNKPEGENVPSDADLDALRFLPGEFSGWEAGSNRFRIAFARAVLAKYSSPQASDEPVAWRYQDARGNFRYRGYTPGFDKKYRILNPIPLYASPTPPASEGQEPVGKPEFAGATVADRLDAMADESIPGSQSASDLYAAATIWRKHLAHPAPQAAQGKLAAQCNAMHKTPTAADEAQVKQAIGKIFGQPEQDEREAFLPADKRREFIRTTSYISEADRDTRIGFVDAIARAAVLADREARHSTLTARVAELEAGLTWYGEQAEGCRKLGPDGNEARNALDADGGKRAAALLAKGE